MRYTVERDDTCPKVRKPFVIRTPRGDLYRLDDGTPVTFTRRYDAERIAAEMDDGLWKFARGEC